ncbi:MAG: DUF998 domain-containing protein, partial [Ilumatobacteraceae bacterium]
MSGPGAGAWIGAACGGLASLSIGVFVVWGGRRRRGYDPWRDPMTRLGDGTDIVAKWFIVVNTGVAALLGAFGWFTANRLDLPRWLLIALLAAAVNSLVIGWTGCRQRCSFACRPGTSEWWVRWLHGLAAVANAVGIIVVPFLVARQVPIGPGDDRAALRVAGLPMSIVAAVLAALYVVDQVRVRRAARPGTSPPTSSAGLLERLLWVVGYAWVVLAAVSLLTLHWRAPTIALAVWLVIALWAVLRPGWRDPSPDFSVADCQPNTIVPMHRLRTGRLVVGRIDHPDQFGSQLVQLLDEEQPTANGAITIALSAKGLQQLGVHYRWNARFVDDAFGLGMQARAGVLGDDPATWLPEWRQPHDLHVVLWLVTSDASADDLYGRVMSTFTSVTPLVDQRTDQPQTPDGRPMEHFGFVDGVGSPWIDRVPPTPGRGHNRGGGALDRSGWRPLELGEFVVGHVDETHDIFPVPNPHEVFEGGSFMVVRMLEQDVAEFQKFSSGRGAVGDALVGRRRDGTPLLPPTEPGRREEFRFGEDPEGARCPIGAHIRRANPRDALGFRSTLTARRRLIRRGMPYGTLYDEDRPGSGDERRGLVFVAYNVRIAEQFE